MNISSAADHTRIHRAARCLAGFLAVMLVALGIVAWKAFEALATIYHDLNIEGTAYHTALRILGTPAPMVFFGMLALCVLIASWRVPLPTLGWLNFAVAVGVTLIFAGLLVLFGFAFMYPARSMGR